MLRWVCILLMVFPAPVQAQVSIYLTFDDGPGPGSRQVYALADSERVNINLFIVGYRATRPDSAADAFRMHRYDSFLLIANHSFSHANSHYRAYYEDPAVVLSDFDRNKDTLKLPGNIARMPGRNFWRMDGRSEEDIVNGREAADSLAAHGYRVIGWDIEWRSDTTGGHISLSGAGMLERIDKLLRHNWTFTKGHVVILLHDQELEGKTFLEKVRELIRLGRADGRHRFEHLTTYPGA